MVNDPLIVGWAHTAFGKRADDTLESLIVTAGREALADAEVDPAEVDLIVLGQFNSGLNPLGFASSLALQIDPSLFGTAALRVENACASGSAAVHTGLTHLMAGTAGTVLVIGAEKMTGVPAETVGAALLGADYDSAGTSSVTGFAGLFAQVAQEYENRYGPVGETLGRIAAKSHRLGAQNPFATCARTWMRSFARPRRRPIRWSQRLCGVRIAHRSATVPRLSCWGVLQPRAAMRRCEWRAGPAPTISSRPLGAIRWPSRPPEWHGTAPWRRPG